MGEIWEVEMGNKREISGPPTLSGSHPSAPHPSHFFWVWAPTRLGLGTVWATLRASQKMAQVELGLSRTKKNLA